MLASTMPELSSDWRLVAPVPAKPIPRSKVSRAPENLASYPCPRCDGRGWYEEHDPNCYPPDCGNTCPIQVQCPRCQARGSINFCLPVEALDYRILPNGLIATITTNIWGQGRLGTVQWLSEAKDFLDDVWEYPTIEAATEAMYEWATGEGDPPDGWLRHPKSKRRRFPDGDPASEVVRE